nr:hypothetical protein [Angustibacter aerolatus]
MRQKAERTKRLQQGVQARDKVLDQLLDTLAIPVPQSLVEAEVHQHLEGENRLEDDEHRAEVTESATKAIQAQLLLDAIVEQEQVQVTQPEARRVPGDERPAVRHVARRLRQGRRRGRPGAGHGRRGGSSQGARGRARAGHRHRRQRQRRRPRGPAPRGAVDRRPGSRRSRSSTPTRPTRPSRPRTTRTASPPGPDRPPHVEGPSQHTLRRALRRPSARGEHGPSGGVGRRGWTLGSVTGKHVSTPRETA